MLRDHDIFNSPLTVDQSQTVSRPTPGAWTRSLKRSDVEVLPIVDDQEASYRDGWCVYTYEHTQAPELEIICGGINAKTPKASGIWRQGFLMHFGFEPSPSEMNANGQALLVNSISYISNFADDRPIVRTPSSFYSRKRMFDRNSLSRLVANEGRDLKTYLSYYLSGKTQARTAELTRREFGEWFQKNRPFLRADDDGKFQVDADAREFGIGNDQPEFIESALSALSDHKRAALARTLLARYVPEGPAQNASVQNWTTWWHENQPYLFFTDTGGCQWLIDPLAKSRGIATTSLRGGDRMSAR